MTCAPDHTAIQIQPGPSEASGESAAEEGKTRDLTRAQRSPTRTHFRWSGQLIANAVLDPVPRPRSLEHSFSVARIH